MLDVRRHMELFDPSTFHQNIHVIGAGATGGWLALQLAKLGIQPNLIHVWDYDMVEEHNVPNQVYGISHIGKPKVEALQEIIKEQTGGEIVIHNEKFTNQRIDGFVFLMVDSMEVRKQIWNNSIKLKRAINHLVEPRMGLSLGRIYNVNPIDLTQIKQYEDTYYGDDEAEVSACGSSMTVITSAMTIASWCVRQLINFHNGIELSNEILLDLEYNNAVTSKW